MQSRLTSLILEKLYTEEENIKFQWNNPDNTKTKHFYIDNLLPNEICMEIFNKFPKNIKNFKDRNSHRERKKTLTNLKDINCIVYDISYAIQSHSVVKKIEKLLNLKNLESDPTLYGSGLSVMFKNDFLNPHIDNSHDRKRKRYRRLNLLYYVTPNWKSQNGGNFELWDSKLKHKKEITSKFNRLIVMETNKTSWHSVNKVKVDNLRCCVSSYFFSNQSPDNKNYFHVTSFSGRPDQFFLKLLSPIDNYLRNAFSKIFMFGRGK
tara:strand:- start:1708 stop:2499 length:792 start_codon:yes stop_codon:yes gene_type:complete